MGMKSGSCSLENYNMSVSRRDMKQISFNHANNDKGYLNIREKHTDILDGHAIHKSDHIAEAAAEVV